MKTKYMQRTLAPWVKKIDDVLIYHPSRIRAARDTIRNLQKERPRNSSLWDAVDIFERLVEAKEGLELEIRSEEEGGE